MRPAALAIALTLGLVGILPGNAVGEPTEITVRVISKDAKFIGTSMGGMEVTLRDARTGEVLANGLTRGGTGDTSKVMHSKGGRRARLADESAAKFTATLDLERPRLIEAEAYGPVAQLQSAHRVTSSQWVVPGKDLSAGDGWVLELPGFVVDVLAPSAHEVLDTGSDSVEIRSNVTMMCGCPVVPGGLWDADRYEVKAVLRTDEGPERRVELSYTGEASRFSGTAELPGPGVYNVYVYAYDPHNGNTGVDRTTFIVPGE